MSSLISTVFNAKFHATLSDIINSEKPIEIQSGGNSVRINTKKIDLNGLKLLFKILDNDYPRKDKSSEIRTIISGEKIKKLYSIFGIPKSITEITSAQLSSHLMWIQSVCSDSNIKIHDDAWDALLEKAIKNGY